jgi:mono/diheme cytochrome c family protein
VTVLFATNARVGTALVVIGALAIFGFLLVASAMGELRGRRTALVPPGFRPGPSDEELEGVVWERVLIWASLTTVLIALWLPAYWLREPTRLAQKKAKFVNFSVDEGKNLFAGDGTPENPGFCARCHGPGGEGTIQPVHVENGDATFAEPPLKYIYSRYKAGGRNEDEITQLIYDAINHGRPGTPMPTWSIAFGGPMNSAQIDDLVAFIRSIQAVFPESQFAPPDKTGAQLFANNSAGWHGHNGAIRDDGTYPIMGTGMTDNGTVGGKLSITPGPNLTVASQRLNLDQLQTTIEHGRLNVNRFSMPSWAALGDAAIQKLVSFIESIQKG